MHEFPFPAVTPVGYVYVVLKTELSDGMPCMGKKLRTDKRLGGGWRVRPAILNTQYAELSRRSPDCIEWRKQGKKGCAGVGVRVEDGREKKIDNTARAICTKASEEKNLTSTVVRTGKKITSSCA